MSCLNLRLMPVVALLTAFAAGAASAQTPVQRGSYLVNGILGCGNCHTPMGPQGPVMERELSGGTPVFDEPAFKVRGSNITPDKETGLGEWSDADIKRALTEGVRPNGVPLAPIMPYAFYRILSPADLEAVVAYLRSVRPSRNEIQTPEYRTAFEAIIPPGAEKPLPDEDMRIPEKAGFYWATIGHCMECHTPMEKDRLQFSLMGKGGREFKGPWGTSVAANITQHRQKGIGAWSDAEIKRAITEGVSRDGRKLKPPMFYAAYAKMTEADLDALVAWLRTVPPKD